MTIAVEVDEFTPNCKKCHALCCVAMAFDWPNYKKPAGVPCKNLDENFKCTKWNVLEEEGYFACRVFSCYGAGQAVAQFVEEEALPDWRESNGDEKAELVVFQRVYQELYNDFHGKPPPVKKDSKASG